MSKWIKKDDKVLVVAGNAKGLTGLVLARKADKVVVKGVNVCKRHLKAKEQGKISQIIEMERPIHISNVCLCDDDGHRIKVKAINEENGQRALYAVNDGQNKLIRILKKAD